MMDTQSLNISPNLDTSTKWRKPKKLSKKEKKLLKKKRKYKNGKGDYWEPIDKTNCITLHLVHRSTNDPLLDIPFESVAEWVLEPEVNCRSDFERVQTFFHNFDLEDTIPHNYRTDQFIDKISAKSMPILPSQQNNINYNYLGPIHEENNDKYDYEQHYRSINDSNFVDLKKCVDKKKRLKDGVEILEEYIFEQEYESNDDNKQDIENKDNDNDDEKLPDHLKQYEAEKYITDKDLEHDPNYKDYMDLLVSDDDNDEKQDVFNESAGDLQDDFVLHAMGIDEEEFKRIQIGTFEPYGARFAKWNEMDRHYDKYYNKENNDNNKESLYDQTINHLMNIQTAKERNSYLDNIEEEEDFGQFDDAEDDDDDDDDTNKGSIAYNPEMALLDNQFEMMLNKEYGDEFIGELDDDMDGLHGDFPCDTVNRFSNKNKKESLRYQYYLYLKHKKRRIRKSLKKSTRDATLQLIGADIINKEEKEINKEIDDDESDEIIYFSDTDSEKEQNLDGNKEIDIKDLESDDERRINAEIDEEFKKKIPAKWDCESILSTRTNHENHPKELKVNVIKLDKKKFIEMDNDGIIKQKKEKKQMGLDCIHQIKNKENNDDEMMMFSFGTIDGNDNNDDIIKEENGKENIFEFNKFDDDVKYYDNINVNDEDMEKSQDKEDVVTAYSKRKGETKEQRKLRKTLKKQLKQQRRKEKKANKEAFKEAQKKQNKLGVTQRKSHGNALRL